MKLICFPHAGGFSFSYYFMKMLKLNALDPSDVILYEYPHRGSRLKEDQYKEFSECVNSIIEEYEPIIANEEFVLFGQSLGGYLAYEVGLTLQNKYSKRPYLTVISGQMPPCYSKEYMVEYNNSEKLNAYLKKMDVSDDFIKKTGESYIQLVCDDLKMFETYCPTEEPEKKNSKIAVVYGERDPEIDVNRLIEWEQYTMQLVDIRGFPGRHFFFNACKEAFVQYLNEII